MSKILKNRYAQKRAAATNAHLNAAKEDFTRSSEITPEMIGQQKKEPTDLTEKQIKIIAHAKEVLNECAGIFTLMARRGLYPEELYGRGWQFITNAREELQSLIYPNEGCEKDA